MSAQEKIDAVAGLKEKLADLEARFRAEAQRRGFDPAQTENMALPAVLAGLFADRENIKSELEEVESAIQREND